MEKLKKYNLSELYEMGSGISSSKEQAGHGYPFASFSTVFNNIFLPDELNDLMDTSADQREKSSIKKGDVLVTRTSETSDELAMSCVALKDYPDATFSGFVKRLRPKKDNIVCPEYIAFYLRSSYFRKLINANTIMTLRASFNEDIFSFLQVYLPKYEIQEKIGYFLHLTEEKIKNNNKINNNLFNQINTLYNYWFVQYNFPTYDNKPYRLSAQQMVYNPIIKREIPCGWDVENIANNRLCTFIKPSVDLFIVKEYLATANVNGTSISTGDMIEYETRESRANMQPKVNSVWFAKMKNSVKHLFLNQQLSELIENTILSTGFCGLQCSSVSFEYIASFINNPYFEVRKDSLAHGATQEAVNNDDLESIYLVVPPDKILNGYHNLTAPLFAQISNNIQANRKLQQLRDFLLPMLMNGQATIAD